MSSKDATDLNDIRNIIEYSTSNSNSSDLSSPCILSTAQEEGGSWLGGQSAGLCEGGGRGYRTAQAGRGGRERRERVREGHGQDGVPAAGQEPQHHTEIYGPGRPVLNVSIRRRILLIHFGTLLSSVI